MPPSRDGLLTKAAFDYSADRQREGSVGPIPPRRYWIQPSQCGRITGTTSRRALPGANIESQCMSFPVRRRTVGAVSSFTEEVTPEALGTSTCETTNC